MTKIIRAGDNDSLGHLDTIQGDFRTQIDALTDAVRQLGGNPEIDPGTTVVNDPLSAPYVLYVNSDIGSDTFVSGDYASADDGSYAQKMRRISLQRLECGYTASRPFRTISRAVLEAGIITSRDYLNITSPTPCGDLVTIVLASGVHEVLNGDGTGVSSAWTDDKVPTDAELTAFNPSNGGLVLPRGCSVVSLDLRKTIVRPTAVPAAADEAADGSNRRAIFKLTGGCYMYGFTIMDKPGLSASHHLLDGFQFAGKAALDEFYANIVTAFGSVADINTSLATTRLSEYQITGPQPVDPAEEVDTTAGASPYIYNISIRSDWGICGMWADGLKTTGFKSMVVAQYTGVSLQRDLTSWQKYSAGTWGTFSNYDQLIDEIPNDVRFNPARRSYHVRTSNNAIIQEVSVFAIGQAIHHLAESGSQITITNSNSNFGGCAAIATGFLDKATPEDTPWDIKIVRRAADPLKKTGNIKKIFLGTLADSVANSATTLKLTADFNPELLTSQDYSLEGGNYLWVDNPGGPDYRALMTATPWESASADEIDITSAVTTDNADGNRTPDGSNELPDIKGNRVYVRRLRDVRSVEERRYSIIFSSGGSERLPIRDYVVQTLDGVADWTDRIQAIAQVEGTDVVSNGANVEFRYSARAAATTAYSTTTYYRPTDVVRRENKHWTARVDNYGAWDDDQWDESYVHMNEAEYCPEGFFINAQPIIIFNEDKDQAEDSTTLGNSLTAGIIEAQLVSGVDYVGAEQLLENLGIDTATAATMLTPQEEASRNLDVSGESWEVEFRRPTTIRLFGHAFEWAGYSNYSKALPQYQGELSQSNQFTYYFTNEDGGKVYGSGFNQDGLLVTPRGLQDVTTGETLDLENIGNPDRPIDIPPVDVFWTRAGTTLQPTYPGDTVTVTSTGGAVNISLNNDGSAEYVAKVQSASTVKTDPGKTLVTKDYLEGDGGFEGDLGFWTREGTDLYPVNGNTDSVKIGGTLPGAPNITLREGGTAIFKDGSSATKEIVLDLELNNNRIYILDPNTGTKPIFQVYSGGSTAAEEEFRVENNGTVLIGNLDQASGPNITLSATSYSSFLNDLLVGVLYSNCYLSGTDPVTKQPRITVNQTSDNPFYDPNGDAIAVDMYATTGTTDRDTRWSVNFDGTTKIGGTLPAAPNITLNQNGDIIARRVFTGPPNAAAPGLQVYRPFDSDLVSFNVLADGTTQIGGNLNDTGSGIQPNITLNADGTGTFSGNVNIGGLPAAPNARILANGAIFCRDALALSDKTTGVNNWSVSAAGQIVMTTKNGESMRIGASANALTATSGVQLTTGSNAWSAWSDENYKTDLVAITDGLNKVSTLRAVTGRYKEDEVGTSRSFLIAQDVEKVLPEAIDTWLTEDKEESLAVKYTEVIPLLVSALHDAKDRIEALEAEVNALKGA